MRAQAKAVWDGRRDDLVKFAWMLALQAMVAERTAETVGGRLTATGTAAASLFADYAWNAGTCRKRSSQPRKWFMFCYGNGRNLVSASEGDVVESFGFSSMDSRAGPISEPHYVTEVMRCHEDAA